MELWVCSQDKETLMKVNNGILYHGTDNRNCIAIKESPSYIHTIGEYKTKQRALEILDEIQNILETRDGVSQMVYVMPKE